MTSSSSAPEGSAPERIRVLIADDHELYRRGMRVVVMLEPALEVVGEAANGREAVESAVELVPDVVLMDVRMPELGGIEACGRIKELVPSAKIIMLTMSDEESDLFEAVKAGASGYLLKEVPGDEVASAVLAVHDGQSIIPPHMATQLLTEFGRLSRVQGADHAPAPHLTERELEVLRLVSRGMANKDIARELFIAENTVKNHVRNILEKLQLHSRVEAAMYAVRRRLIDQR